MDNQTVSKSFSHLIQVTPLGLLYGSAGRFLSPENLVGRSGKKFPPSSATLSGLYIQMVNGSPTDENTEGILPELNIAGPFWSYNDNLQNFYVPTPLIYSVAKKTTTIKYRIELKSPRSESEPAKWEPFSLRESQIDQSLPEKFDTNTWLAINDWNNITPNTQVKQSPWQFLPHLHPRLQENQRHTEEGDLFLENAVQVDPEVSLIYLATYPLENGWYRFGGEGHMVEIQCHDLNNPAKDLLNKPINKEFALITDAVWGSNRFSYRFPQEPKSNPSRTLSEWEHEALICDRPLPYRYRLGGRLSRGRYAVPAGSVYVLKKSLGRPWHDWPTEWFPSERYSFKRWGCGLALPIAI